MKLSVMQIQGRAGQAPFYFRGDSVGDNGAIRQIFHDRDYDASAWPQGGRLWEYHQRQIKSRPSLIVDAGANIGAASVYFLEAFENAFVYAIEPEEMNFQILEMNTRRYENKIAFNGAIAAADGEVGLEDPGLSDWGFRTRPVAEGGKKVKSVTPATILSDPRVAGFTPLIFKIDIEGAESDLFSGDTSWMARFPLIIIELHDWLLPFSGSSRTFFHAIVKYDFDFLHRGENIFLFSRPILAGNAARAA